MTTAADVVAAARAQMGVPWVHQGRLAGKALDCAGLIIAGVCWPLGIFPRDLDVNGYSRNADGSMISILDELCDRIEAPELGCVICMRSAKEPTHLGIAGNYLRGGLSLIHATNAAKPPRVVEHKLTFLSTMQLVGAWRLPGVV